MEDAQKKFNELNFPIQNLIKFEQCRKCVLDTNIVNELSKIYAYKHNLKEKLTDEKIARKLHKSISNFDDIAGVMKLYNLIENNKVQAYICPAVYAEIFPNDALQVCPYLDKEQVENLYVMPNDKWLGVLKLAQQRSVFLKQMNISILKLNSLQSAKVIEMHQKFMQDDTYGETVFRVKSIIDAYILAECVVLGMPLITRNTADFFCDNKINVLQQHIDSMQSSSNIKARDYVLTPRQVEKNVVM